MMNFVLRMMNLVLKMMNFVTKNDEFCIVKERIDEEFRARKEAPRTRMPVHIDFEDHAATRIQSIVLFRARLVQKLNHQITREIDAHIY